MDCRKIKQKSGRGDVLNRIVKEEVNEEMAFEPSLGRHRGPSRAFSGRETGSAKAPGEDCALRGLAGRERKGGRGGKEEVIKAIGVQSCMNSQSLVQTLLSKKGKQLKVWSLTVTWQN